MRGAKALIWGGGCAPLGPPGSSAYGSCTNPSSLNNGVVISTGNSVGDTAIYTCNHGFELIGTALATCTQARSGDSASFLPVDPPTCQRMYSHIVLSDLSCCCCKYFSIVSKSQQHKSWNGNAYR